MQTLLAANWVEARWRSPVVVAAVHAVEVAAPCTIPIVEWWDFPTVITATSC